MNARRVVPFVPIVLLVLPLAACPTPEVESGVEVEGAYAEGPGSQEECRERIRHLEERLHECREEREGEYREYRDSVPGWYGTFWGMSPEAVRAKLPQARQGEGRTLEAERTIADRPARIELGFDAKGLDRVTVLFFPGDPNRATAKDFDDVRSLLRHKYGAPDEETSTFDRPTDTRTSAAVELVSTWYRGPTRIVLELDGPSGKPELTLTYRAQGAPPSRLTPESTSLEGL